ncbi:hypothetical protein P7C70_g7435, partial [Phenoliferia sp. Uapishka_3]
MQAEGWEYVEGEPGRWSFDADGRSRFVPFNYHTEIPSPRFEHPELNLRSTLPILSVAPLALPIPSIAPIALPISSIDNGSKFDYESSGQGDTTMEESDEWEVNFEELEAKALTQLRRQTNHESNLKYKKRD